MQTPETSRLAQSIDHTLLKPGLLQADITKLCNEAVENNFAAVCVPPLFVKHAKLILGDAPVKLATVIGFPFGYSAVEAKIAECLLAILDGADELDVVINFTAIKNNDWDFLANELTHILAVVRHNKKVIKVILETGVLSEDEIIKCCSLYGVAGVDFVKTSTGYAEVGATIDAVKLLRSHLPSQIKIKASGGIKTSAFANALLKAGATRLGCSSSIAILKGSSSNADY